MVITCPVNDTIGVCSTLDSAGAGLGVFIQYLGIALPAFLITLAVIGVFVVVGGAIGYVIRNAMTKVHVK